MTIIDDTRALTGSYDIDTANSRIGFAARYAMVTTVRGAFGRFSARVRLDGETPGRSSVAVRIDSASLDTGQAQRDEHLRSPDFLDVATYPEIIFQSTDIQPRGDNRYRMCGELTVCSVTKPIDVECTLTGVATDHRGYQLVGFAGTAVISRAAFGLTWNTILETGGVLVGDQVDLSLDIALIRSNADERTTAGGRWRSMLRLAR